MLSSRSDWERELNASTEAHASRQVCPPELRVPALTVLAHPDPRRVGERVLLPALGSGRTVPLSRLSPLFAQPGDEDARPLADPHLSRRPFYLTPGERPGSIRIATEAGGGRIDLLGALVADEVSAAELERGAVALLADRVALLFHLLPVLPREPERFGLIGDSAGVDLLRREIRRVSVVATPVLLRGETGTGKELVARAIHTSGPRRDRPYLTLNLGAIPPALAAAELFGAARGAFTGADRRRPGHFERADAGTLFLDEVGEASPEVQVLLLRALENGEIQPVGSEAPLRVDVRIVAATDADLEAAVSNGRFRAPLLHRLRGFEIRLPALRERRDDVGRLLVSFLRQELAALGSESLLDDPGPHGRPWLPADLVARLAAYDWPGNVRELRNVARHIAVGCHDAAQAELPAVVEATLRAPAAGEERSPEAPAGSEGQVPKGRAARAEYRPISEISDDELIAALRASRWNLAGAAGRLRVSRTSLYARVERHGGIRKAGDLSRDEIAAALERSGGDLDAAADALGVSPHGLKIRRTELGSD
jgi:two-component system, NtrC family, nitrogen regulation response regulator GlnG